MIVILLQLLLFSCAWGFPQKFGNVIDSIKNARIVGGEVVPISCVPYQVSVSLFEEHICGGSIISQKFVLTAAHCLTSHSTPGDYSIRAGSSIRNDGGVIRRVTNIFINPNYDDLSIDYDISILQLASPLTYENSINYITLANANIIIPDNTRALVTGWGYTSEEGNSSTLLNAVIVPVVSNERCRQRYPNEITDRMLCAGYESGGKDSCYDDSGGPLVAEKYGQIGIVSWGVGCGRPGFYGVYANVSNLRPWIDSVVKA